MTPMKPTSTGRRCCAFTLTELLVLIAVLLLLAGLVVPAAINFRAKAQRIRCVSYLAMIGKGFRLWAEDHGDLYPMSVSTNKGGTQEYSVTGETFRHFQVLSNELNRPFILACLADRTRRPAKDFDPAFSNGNVSYFVGLDADETRPDMLLTGDRNLVGGTRLPHGIRLITTNDTVSWSREIHRNQGTVALGDGSVQQFSGPKLAEHVRASGVATNRLAMP